MKEWTVKSRKVSTPLLSLEHGQSGICVIDARLMESRLVWSFRVHQGGVTFLVFSWGSRGFTSPHPWVQH